MIIRSVLQDIVNGFFFKNISEPNIPEGNARGKIALGIHKNSIPPARAKLDVVLARCLQGLPHLVF
jgi:hypothetical protein